MNALAAFAAAPPGVPKISISNARVVEGNSGTTNMIFTISLSQPSTNFIYIDYATQDGLAVAGQDYVQVSLTQLGFPPNVTNKTISVQVKGDTTPESDEDFVVGIFNPRPSGFVTIGQQFGTGTIVNDDTAAFLSIDSVSKFEGNSGTNYFVFNVSLVGNTKFFPTVDYYTVGAGVSGGAATGGTNAAPGVDFLLQKGTLVFTPTITNKTITVPVLSDLAFEPDENFLVILTNANSAVISPANAIGIGTILNDDANALPSITINDVSLAEGNSGTTPVNFTVSLSAPSASPITVTYSTADGTATVLDQDYQPIPITLGKLTFNPGETVKFITVNVLGDTKVELDETFTVKLSSAPGAVMGKQTGTCTILNDDSATQALLISVNDAQLVEGDSGTNVMIFDVVLSAPLTNGFIVVNYTTADGTATAGVDYVGATNSSAIFFPGSTKIPIRIPILGDYFVEPDETFFVNLSSVTNFQGATVTLVRTQATGTILNDDSPPIILINDTSVLEGNGGATNVVFTVSLSHPSPLPVTVDYLTQEGTASAEVDYVNTNGSLAFAPFETSKTFSVTINGDTLFEVDEYFLVILGNAAGGDIADGQGHGFILNDDQKPALSIANVSRPEGDDPTGTNMISFTASLSAPSGQPVSLNFFTSNGSALAGRDYIATNGPLTLAPGLLDAEIAVPILGNTIPGADTFFFLNLTNVTGATPPAVSFAIGTIQNDDAVPLLSVDDPQVFEGDAGTNFVTFTITLLDSKGNSTPSGVQLTVPYFTLDGTATAGTDYVGASGSLTINAGATQATLKVPVLGDVTAEPDETFSLKLLPSPNVALKKDTGTATISNDDVPVQIAITDAFVNEGAAGDITPMQFTVSLSTSPILPVSVDYATASAIAQAGTDFISTNGTLRFGPGETSQVITVNVLGNDFSDNDRVFLVNLTHAVNATLQDDQAFGFIIEDDFLPSVRIDDAAITEADAGTANMVFTLTLSQSSSVSVTVDFATADGTAKAGSDYVATSGKITFPPNALTQTIQVPIIGDLLGEPTETFFVNLSNPVNAVLPDSQAIGTITDNDSLPFVNISDTTIVEGDAGTANAVFTVTLGAASAQPVQVNYSTTPGSASAGTDFVAASGTVKFPPNTTTQTISVSVNGDTLNEPDETFFVNLNSPVGARIGDGQGTGTILNDDLPPLLSVADASVHEGLQGTRTNLLFTVQLSEASGQDVTANFSTADGTGSVDTMGTAGIDYLATNGVVRLKAGETNKTIAVTVLGNSLKQEDRNFLLTLSSITNAIVTKPQAIGTILDDDAPPLIFISDASVNEGNAGTTNLVFQVTLSEPSGQLVSVDYATADGTATAATDYQPTSGTLNFNPTVTNLTIRVLVNGDLFNEPNETLFVKLSNPTHAALTNLFGTGTILNDDSLPTISVADLLVIEGDSGTSAAVIHVKLSSASAQTVTVLYATADGTAIAGSDYQPASGTLTFAPGETDQPISLLVVGDLFNEPSETFFVKFFGATNASLPVSQATITIRDNDPLPLLRVSDVSVTEGNGGTTAAVFTVDLSQPSNQDVTVDFATADGTAKAGSDYQAANGALKFTAGVTRQTFTVLINGDTLDEPDETFDVLLKNAVNATIAKPQAQGTIFNDDAQPDVTINNVTVVEGNGGAVSANFNVTLSNPSQQTVTVDFATADSTATAGKDYAATSGTLTFLPGQVSQPVRVTILGDNLNEPTEQFLVNLSNPSNARLGSSSQGTGTITDDDPVPSLLVTDALILEGNSGVSMLVFRLRLSTVSAQTGRVDFATVDGTATAGQDYIATNGTALFLPGTLLQTISVPVLGDTTVEPDETLQVILSNPSNLRLVSDHATGTIRNDEELPSLTITDASVVEGDRGQTNLLFSVLLSQASSQIVTVDFDTTGGSATAGSDFIAQAATLTFAPGMTRTNISIAVLGDTSNEPDESFLVTLKNPVNAVLARAQGQGTILNDDAGNSPPFGVALISPVNRSTFPPTSSIALKATASDSDGVISRVEFYAGSTLIGSATTVPYTFVWQNVPVGDYSLTAKAIDDQGASTTSAAVDIVVTEISGDVAIVQNFPAPEILKLQDYLFEMGISSHVFNQEGLTFEALQQFQLVIWDDLGDRTKGLTDDDVALFQRVFTNGIPLYLIGDQLAASTANLGPAARSQWTSLLHLTSASTKLNAGTVGLVDTERDGPLLKSRFGRVDDFSYTLPIDLTAVADPDAQVIATAGAGDVLVAFPLPSLGETGTTRSFTQNVRVFTGVDDASIESRKRLFQNVVCWLIRCSTCGAIDLLLEGDAALSTVPVGSQLVYNLVVRQSGECEGIGVVLTDQLPPNVDFVTANSTKGTWQYADGVVRFYLGHVTSASVTDLSITVTPTQPGSLTNSAVVNTSGPEVSKENNTVKLVTTVTGSARPVIGIALTLDSRPEIRLQSLPGRNYTVESSVNLIQWLPWTNVLGDGTLLRLLDTPNNSAPFRFYRARENTPP